MIPNTVDLLFAFAASFQSQALNRNELCIAEGLDDLVSSSNPRAVDLVTFLGNVLPGQLPLAFELISPDEYASAYTISFSHATVQNANLQRHLEAVRAGAGGYCPPAPEVEPMPKDANPPISDKNVVSDKYVAPTAVEMPECRWSFWGTGTGQFVDVDGDRRDLNGSSEDEFGTRGYEISTGGFIGGADYRVSKHFIVGISGAFASSEADFGGDFRTLGFNDSAKVEVDGGKIGLYATAFAGGFYVDVAGSAGWNDYDLRRGGLLDGGGFVSSETVHSETDGAEWNGMIGTGYDFHRGCLTIGPTATFQITHVELNSFNDHSAGDDSSTTNIAALHFPDQDETSARMTLGGRLAYDWHVGKTIIRPELRAAWLHEFDNTDYHIRFAFDEDIAGSDDRHFCNVFGPDMGQDSAQVGAGVSIQFTRCMALYANYDGMFSSHYDSQAGSGGIRFGF